MPRLKPGSLARLPGKQSGMWLGWRAPVGRVQVGIVACPSCRADVPLMDPPVGGRLWCAACEHVFDRPQPVTAPA